MSPTCQCNPALPLKLHHNRKIILLGDFFLKALKWILFWMEEIKYTKIFINTFINTFTNSFIDTFKNTFYVKSMEMPTSVQFLRCTYQCIQKAKKIFKPHAAEHTAYRTLGLT